MVYFSALDYSLEDEGVKAVSYTHLVRERINSTGGHWEAERESI